MELVKPSKEKSTLLAVQNLQVRYGAIQALFNVNLEVRDGEIVTLLGANGAGKTTTLRAISGLVPIAGGVVNWKGESLLTLSHSKRLREASDIVRLGISHSPEGRRIFGNLSVDENLEMGTYFRSRATTTDKQSIEFDRDRVFVLFPRLKERLKQLAGTLSGGEQQMLAIARALMQRPKLLMLDEPSLGIAPVLVEGIFRALIEVNKQGTPLLIVEQNAQAALAIAHRAYVLEIGQTTLSGPAHEIAKNPKIISAYLGHS
jgi:branched-chain amino acid transport system ATP-binding protein